MPYRTYGETLFHLIRNECFESPRHFHQSWEVLSKVMGDASGSTLFSDYIRGTFAVHAVRRALRIWSEYKDVAIPDDIVAVKTADKLIRTEIFPGLDAELRLRLARATVYAGRASNRDITKSVRKSIISKDHVYECYLCGHHLDPKQTGEKQKDFLTLEHLWPSSLGGESEDENLLPACRVCQEAKADALSWESYNVHNLVLASSPSEQKLVNISKSRRLQIAIHTFHAVRHGAENGKSLKESFLAIGPMHPKIRHLKTSRPVTFFDLSTI